MDRALDEVHRRSASGIVPPGQVWPASEHIQDMHDGPGDVPDGTHLAKAIELCEQTLRTAFDDYDRMAISQQRRHVWTVRVAASLGTFSILVTLGQLVLGGELEAFEVAAGVFAVIAVLLGLRGAFQKDWLLNRYRAERLRALKFSYLMGPASWSNDTVTSNLAQFVFFRRYCRGAGALRADGAWVRGGSGPIE